MTNTKIINAVKTALQTALPSSLTTAIDKTAAKIITKASAVLPIHIQIKGAHLFQTVKKRVLNQSGFPDFIEKPIPEVSTLALADIDLSNPFLFRQHRWESYYKRLRDEDLVHYQANSPFGAFWSVMRYEDIVFVDKHYELFSSEPVILMGNQPEELKAEMFIAMDPPKHDI